MKYFKQIYQINSSVIAEICYISEETKIRAHGKEFNSIFRNAPTEKMYKKAHNWCDKQLELLIKYQTEERD